MVVVAKGKQNTSLAHAHEHPPNRPTTHSPPPPPPPPPHPTNQPTNPANRPTSEGKGKEMKKEKEREMKGKERKRKARKGKENGGGGGEGGGHDARREESSAQPVSCFKHPRNKGNYGTELPALQLPSPRVSGTSRGEKVPRHTQHIPLHLPRSRRQPRKIFYFDVLGFVDTSR